MCFACKKPGRTSANCPTKSDVRNLESEDEGAAALMVEAKFVYSANSFEALAPESDDEDGDYDAELEPKIVHRENVDAELEPKILEEQNGDRDEACCRFQCESRGIRCRQRVLQ